MKENAILEKSKAFSLRIIRLYYYLCNEKKEYIISKQLFRSGTSIGANAREATRGQTSPMFYSKMNIALGEADESEYWLELLHESGIITDAQFESLHSDVEELIRILVSITKAQKQ